MQPKRNNQFYNAAQLNILDLGTKDYKEVWKLQLNLHNSRVKGLIPDTLILVEHNPVITIGKSGARENLLVSTQELENMGIEFYRVERGGDATFHGPGQIVGYPVFDIKNGLAGIRPFIERIEGVIIRVLEDFGISAKRREKMIGVWTDYGKICSIGIAVRRWVSFHGFALNVNTDLKYFGYINPCGFRQLRMTSMAEILKERVDLSRVKQSIADHFVGLFKKSGFKQICLEEII